MPVKRASMVAAATALIAGGAEGKGRDPGPPDKRLIAPGAFDRIAVAGHSEGGAVAMIAAAKEDDIKSLVLIAAPGTTVTYQAPNGRDISVEVVAVEPFVP